jgi:cysteine desulfurase/selenocysteine lyase
MSQQTAAPFSAAEVAALRAETPGCANVIHFNHAGASLMPQPVVDATVGHILREAAIGGYEAADEAEARIDGVYDAVARLLGAQRQEIAIVENATRAWDMAFYAIPLQAGDRILTSKSEYTSNLIAFFQAAARGVSVEVVPSDATGQMDVAALANLLDARVKVVAVSHMPTNGGLVQPAAAIGRLAREAGALFVLDACQTAGQLPLDVAAIGCDVLSATSRKYLRGPRGAGFLYVREEVIERLVPPMLDLHAAEWTGPGTYEIRADARRFENWESNLAGTIGMGAAIDYALDLGLERIRATVQARAEELRGALAAIPGVTVRDLGAERGGIVTWDLVGVDSAVIRDALAAERINTTTTSKFSTPYDAADRGLPLMVRSSVHYVTTSEEIATIVAAVQEIAG